MRNKHLVERRDCLDVHAVTLDDTHKVREYPISLFVFRFSKNTSKVCENVGNDFEWITTIRSNHKATLAKLHTLFEGSSPKLLDCLVNVVRVRDAGHNALRI